MLIWSKFKALLLMCALIFLLFPLCDGFYRSCGTKPNQDPCRHRRTNGKEPRTHEPLGFRLLEH